MRSRSGSARNHILLWLTAIVLGAALAAAGGGHDGTEGESGRNGVRIVTLSAATAAGEFANPEPVAIEGYRDEAMEPFLTRDDRVLLFNDSNAPGRNTDLHWAERVSAVKFRYRGRVEGANSAALDGVPTVDRSGALYFVSVRSYDQSLSTVHRAMFRDGRATELALVEGVSRMRRGQVIFDVEISADGDTLYMVDGVFTGGPMPQSADIVLARRVGDRFERQIDSSRILANINTRALEYAPAISADQLELFFTRMTGALFWRKLKILHATRPHRGAPFGIPQVITAISGFVEAPTISSDGRSLYFHKKVEGEHRIYRVTR